MRSKMHATLAVCLLTAATSLAGSFPLLTDMNVQAQEAVTEEAVTEGEQVPQGYLVPDVAERYLTEADLKDMDARIAAYAKNEIYARHGYQFLAPELNEYFESQEWYECTVKPEEFSEAVFNKYEAANHELLMDWELSQAKDGYTVGENTDYTSIYEYLNEHNKESVEPESEEETAGESALTQK